MLFSPVARLGFGLLCAAAMLISWFELRNEPRSNHSVPAVPLVAQHQQRPAPGQAVDAAPRALSSKGGARVGAHAANTSHAGWPRITGMLLMNKRDQHRPLDGRAGHDPFGGADDSYSCDGLHKRTACIASGGPSFSRRRNAVPEHVGHNELLGGHGNDIIHAGDAGDVLWGDYKPSGQPTRQTDRLSGGPGNDFIYASHGRNIIATGSGRDVVHAHFGHGSITCGSAQATVFISHRSRKGYRLSGCRRISYKTLGY